SPFLVEHHQSGRSDRLRHRVEAKNRVGLHSLVLFQIREPDCAQVSDLAVPRNQDNDAGNFAATDLALVEVVQVLQPGGGEPEFLRAAPWQLGSGSWIDP